MFPLFLLQLIGGTGSESDPLFLNSPLYYRNLNPCLIRRMSMINTGCLFNELETLGLKREEVLPLTWIVECSTLQIV